MDNAGVNDLTDDDDSEYYDEEEESSSMEDYQNEQSEEDEEDEEDMEDFSDSDDSMDQDEKMSEPQIPSHVVEQLETIIEKQPVPTTIIEQPTPLIEQPIIETEITVTEIVSPPTPTAEVIPQTQTPPITPDQSNTSRKRPLPTDDDEEEEEAGSPPVIREPTPIYEQVLPQAERVDQSRDEQSVKRRRIDDEETGKQGWTSIAYTLVKYTVAAGVGGIATIAGLVWVAQQQQ